jgi:chaperone BCS1
MDPNLSPISIDTIRQIKSFTDVWPFFLHQFYTNQFLQAAIVAGFLGGLSYMCRATPKKIWRFIRRTISTDVQFNSDLPDYNFIQELISKEIVSSNLSRRYLYSCEENYDWEQEEYAKTHIGLTAGYGVHWGWFKNPVSMFGRTFVWIDRELMNEGGSNTEKFKEKINLTFMTRRRRVIEAFTRMVEEKAGKLHDIPTVQLHVNNGDWWKKGGKLPIRPVSTVFTKDNAGQMIVAKIKEFEARREWCLLRGLPHRLGIMLDGPAGTGKSSLLHAIASETGRTLYYLNLGGVDDDKELMNLLSSGRNWKKTLLVIEDFDATGVKVARKEEDTEGKQTTEKKGVTLSALLNSLDGLIAPDGLVVVATTNYPERLDPALVRPGRFDIRVHLGPLDYPQFDAMARLFGHDPDSAPAIKENFTPTTGATLRALLLQGGLADVEKHFTSGEPMAA